MADNRDIRNNINNIKKVEEGSCTEIAIFYASIGVIVTKHLLHEIVSEVKNVASATVAFGGLLVYSITPKKWR